MPNNFTIAPTDVVEVTARATYQGQVCLNVAHYFYTGAASLSNGLGELEALNDSFMNEVLIGAQPDLDGLTKVQVEGYQYTSVRSQMVYPQRYYFVEKLTPLLKGTVVGGGIPSNTHFSASFRTTGTHRGDSGNKKITGLSTNAISGNVFSTQAYTDALTAVGKFRLSLKGTEAAANWRPIVWGPKNPQSRKEIIGLSAVNAVRTLTNRGLLRGI